MNEESKRMHYGAADATKAKSWQFWPFTVSKVPVTTAIQSMTVYSVAMVLPFGAVTQVAFITRQ